MWLAKTLVPAVSANAVLFLLFVIWQELAIGESLDGTLAVAYDSPVIDEFQARVSWAVSAVGILALMAWNAALSLIIVTRHAHARLRQLLVGVAVLEALVLIGFVEGWDIGGDSIVLIRTAIASKTKLDTFRHVGLLEGAGAIVVAFVITAACSLISPKPDGTYTDLRMLARRVSDARLCLYSACLLLAGAVAEVYFLYSWPASFVVVGDQPFVRQLAATAAVAAGCVFTLLLLFVFVPVWLIHANWITAAAEVARKPDGWKREDWLKEFNLENSPLSLLGRVIVTLAPAILGLIPRIVDQQ